MTHGITGEGVDSARERSQESGLEWGDLPELPTAVALHGAVRSVAGGDGLFEYLVAIAQSPVTPGARD